MTTVNGYEDYSLNSETGADSQAQREARGNAFVSRRRRLRNRWNVRMVKGERAQQLVSKQGGNTLYR